LSARCFEFEVIESSSGSRNLVSGMVPKMGFPVFCISFLNPDTERIQQHIDYRVSVTNDGDYVFGPMSRLLHTSPGSITIPVEFSENGSHIIQIEVEGVLFQPIPLETATLTINVGQAETSIPSWIKNNAGWWANGEIDDNSFVTGLQWLISNGIMKIS